jgi:hypothetical protein
MATDRRDDGQGRAPAPRRRGAAPELAVTFLPPATPEEEADAWRRWVEAMDWLATIGALDA